MKRLSIFLYAALVLGCVLYLGACKDDKLSDEARIVHSFNVKGTSGAALRGVIGDDVVTIKVSPYLNAEEELNGVTPVFYLSKGATISPDPSEPQNFAQSGGVKYTVTAEDGTKKVYTVTWGVSDPVPYGGGFTYAEIGTGKLFTELGYPGLAGSASGVDGKLHGDLRMYIAYCGDNIVLLSRDYVASDPTSPHCIKVVNKTTLEPAAALNLGSISVVDLKVITSDYKGNCVGLVVTGGQTEFFYWKTPADAPRSVGSINVDMASAAGSSNFQVAGDITTAAWITALAPRGANGEHYRIKVTGGSLASDYSTVATGYSSSDCNGSQMISPLDDSDRPSYIVGDAEGTAGAANSVHAYINSPGGATVSAMPGYWQNILQSWWIGTGFATFRGCSPFVSALPINGKTYTVVTSGSNWWFVAAVLSADLQQLAHINLNIALDTGTSRGWSNGEWVDWYWNDNANEAYMAVWFERIGLYTYKMTCFE